jgi:hypothetical protein
MVPCIGTVSVPEPAAAAAPPLALRRGLALASRHRQLRRGGAGLGTHIDTENFLPLTSTSTSRRTFGSSPSRGSPALAGFDDTSFRSSTVSTHLVECSNAAKSGCEDREVGGDRGGHALDDRFLERTDHAGDGGRAVLAPHAELADEVVVVLADLVALFVAAVPAHAVAGGDAQLGERAGGGEEAAAGDVLALMRPRWRGP